MTPGPSKQFDPKEALARARDLFWRKGFDGTAISELEAALGVGRKSLYDTFGSKRQLYLRAIDEYTESVIGRICRGLEDARNEPIDNLERVLDRLQAHHSSPESLGCLLGVAMGQIDPADKELAELLRGHLLRMEQAFERTLASAQEKQQISADVSATDVARNLVALTQGLALTGRITESESWSRSIVRAAMHSLKV